MKASELPYAKMAEGARESSPSYRAPLPPPPTVVPLPVKRCPACEGLLCSVLVDRCREAWCCWCGRKFDSDGKGGLARLGGEVPSAPFLDRGYYFFKAGTAKAPNGWIVTVIVAIPRRAA